MVTSQAAVKKFFGNYRIERMGNSPDYESLSTPG